MILPISPYSVNYKSSVVKKPQSFCAEKKQVDKDESKNNFWTILDGLVGLIAFCALGDMLTEAIISKTQPKLDIDLKEDFNKFNQDINVALEPIKDMCPIDEQTSKQALKQVLREV